MNLPYSTILIFLSPSLLLAVIVFLQRRSVVKNKTELEKLKKNQLYKDSLIKELQVSIEYGKNLENVINALCTNLSQNFPFSTLSSLYLNGQNLIFKSNIKESVNRAFVNHIKDTMQTQISNPQNLHRELVENYEGMTLDDLTTTTILSSFDLKINVKENTVAVVNLASTKPNQYKEGDIKNLETVAEYISLELTKIDSQLDVEKSKTLSMIDSFAEGIFMLDKDLRMIAMNNSALNFLNIHKEIPTFNDVLSALPNSFNFKDRIALSIAQNKQISLEDIPVLDKIFRIIITPVVDVSHAGNIIGASVLLQDTTIEKSLSHLKEDFTNIMVHELRSPITAIRASSEFLLSRADLTDSEKLQLTHMISDSSKKMLDKISLILDSAKMDAGLFSIKKTPSDLKKLIDGRIALFAQVAAEKQILLKVEIDPALTTFSFDPIRIDEVINNLLSNSLKFTPNGGSITLSVRIAKDKVNVSVTDTGSGIPKDKQHLLFSKFQQAPTDGQHQGTGLGLYVVKGVVEAHGGEVNLESDEGKGTTISFTLPLSGSVQPLAAPVVPPKTPNQMSN